jgi:CRP-like cAMP-binding protein
MLISDNSERLFKFLDNFRSFTLEEKLLISSKSKNVILKKNDVFVESGLIANYVGFVLSGVLRYFFYDKDGNDITSTFVAEDQFLTTIISFTECSPSLGTLQAETDCELLVFPRENYEILATEIKDWDGCIIKILNKILFDKTQILKKRLQLESKYFYLEFQKAYPKVVNRVPLNHISSFLGITPYSLSRIRRQLSKEPPKKD